MIDLFLATETSSGSFWNDLWSVTLDPAHIGAELIFTIVFDGIVIAIFYNIIFKKIVLPRIKKTLRHEIHEEIDKEHGFEHEK